MKTKILISCLALAFAMGSSAEAAVLCAEAHLSSQNTKALSLNRLSTQILNGYLQMDSRQLKQVLLEAGIPASDLTARPIYKGGTDPQNVRIQKISKNGTMTTTSELVVDTEAGKPLATLLLTTEIPRQNLQSGQTLVANKTRARVLTSETDPVRGSGMGIDRVQTSLRNAFLQVNKTALKQMLAQSGVSEALLKYDPIYRGADAFTELSVDHFKRTQAGFQSASLSGVIDLFTYYGDPVARVKMTTEILPSGEVQNTSFELSR